MIARARLMLPFLLSVRSVDQLRPIEFVRAPYTVRIYPPQKSGIALSDVHVESDKPLYEVVGQLRLPPNQTTTEFIKLDGAPTVQADLLQIDFLREAFDRRRTKPNLSPEESVAVGDPSARVIFDVANDFLSRLRSLTRGAIIRSLDPKRTFWHLEYLTDNQEEFPADPELTRRRKNAPMRWTVIPVATEMWQQLAGLGAFAPHRWESLLLDAEALLPDIGGCLMLAYASLESFIAWCLDVLAAPSGIPPELWSWINGRDDFYKEPSVEESFDALLKILAGKSLKSDNRLWEAFCNLRTARNKLAHNGRAMIGGRDVTLQQAETLLEAVKSIIMWCESLIPADVRRPTIKAIEVQLFRTLVPANVDTGPATPSK